IRLWSTVVIQLATRPRFQSARYGGTSVLTATREPSLQVAEQRVDLRVGPVLADGRHPALALPEELLERLPVGERRVPRDLRAVGALAERPVALRAGARERLLPDRCAAGPVRGEEAAELLGGDDDDVRPHRRVVEAAELGALAWVGAEPVGLEPRRVHAPGNRVDLSAETRDPPAVGDVGRRHLEPHDAPGRDDHRVDRELAVRVAELPVELVRLHLDRQLLAGSRGGHVLDPGELVEDEGGDRGEDQDRDDRPGDLEPGRAVDLHPLCVARPAPPPVADHEPDERAFDDDEDEGREPEDHPVGVVDPGGVRRDRRLGAEAAVPGKRARPEDEGEQGRDEQSRDQAAHDAGILWGCMGRAWHCREARKARSRSTSTGSASARESTSSGGKASSTSSASSRTRGGSGSGAGSRSFSASPAPTASTRASTSSTKWTGEEPSNQGCLSWVESR